MGLTRKNPALHPLALLHVDNGLCIPTQNLVPKVMKWYDLCNALIHGPQPQKKAPYPPTLTELLSKVFTIFKSMKIPKSRLSGDVMAVLFLA